MRGDLERKLGKTEQAETTYRESLLRARKMNAKSWELRASTSLTQLLRDGGRSDEMRGMLDEIYNWFTEGFVTADLKDAKALLDERGGVGRS